MFELVGKLLTQETDLAPFHATDSIVSVFPPSTSWVYSHSYRLPVFSASQSSSLISSATAAALLSSGAVDYCLHVLRSLLEYWKSQQSDEEPVATSQLLKPHTTSSPPDMSPFFLRQYVKVRSFPRQQRTAPVPHPEPSLLYTHSKAEGAEGKERRKEPAFLGGV